MGGTLGTVVFYSIPDDLLWLVRNGGSIRQSVPGNQSKVTAIE